MLISGGLRGAGGGGLLDFRKKKMVEHTIVKRKYPSSSL